MENEMVTVELTRGEYEVVRDALLTINWPGKLVAERGEIFRKFPVLDKK